ncbi:MAG TPA: hypothetical protein VGO92_06560 [Acidimicrobiales bacterium]|jgi:hypothetical protein|nr:hypothetical protein [Acidimicrobiales bacterium]
MDADDACSLDPADLPARVAEWQSVLGFVRGRSPRADGVRLALAPDAPVAEIARLMTAEQDCCRFFSFALTVDDRGLALEVTAPPSRYDVLAALFLTPAASPFSEG